MPVCTKLHPVSRSLLKSSELISSDLVSENAVSPAAACSTAGVLHADGIVFDGSTTTCRHMASSAYWHHHAQTAVVQARITGNVCTRLTTLHVYLAMVASGPLYVVITSNFMVRIVPTSEISSSRRVNACVFS